MKKQIIILSLIVLANVAMGQVFTEKSSIISGGIGVPNMLKSTLSEFGINATGGPVIYGLYEHALNENWSIGVLIGHAAVTIPGTPADGTPGSWWYVPATPDENWSILLIGAKADYHFGNENVDAYAGA